MPPAHEYHTANREHVTDPYGANAASLSCRSSRRAKRELCPGYERSSRHNLCKGTAFLDLVL